MRNALICSMLTVKVFTGQALSAEQEPEQVSVAVHLYNYAAISDEEMRIVKQEVFRIFKSAGIHTKVAGCPLSPPEADRYPECDGSQPVELNIHLRPGLPSHKLAKSGDVFGLAFLPHDGRLGIYAHVYVGGATILARRSKSLEPRMLGHLIAHEMGISCLERNRIR